MTDSFVILLLTVGAFIVMLVNVWIRKGPLAIVGCVAWFCVALYCLVQVRNSGDADYGTWTWAFAFIALLCSIFTGLTPKIFANPAVQDETDEFDEAVAYREDQKRAWKEKRSLGMKKKKEIW